MWRSCISPRYIEKQSCGPSVSMHYFLFPHLESKVILTPIIMWRQGPALVSFYTACGLYSFPTLPSYIRSNLNFENVKIGFRLSYTKENCVDLLALFLFPGLCINRLNFRKHVNTKWYYVQQLDITSLSYRGKSYTYKIHLYVRECCM